MTGLNLGVSSSTVMIGLALTGLFYRVLSYNLSNTVFNLY